MGVRRKYITENDRKQMKKEGIIVEEVKIRGGRCKIVDVYLNRDKHAIRKG